jgi:hypothetical protein
MNKVVMKKLVKIDGKGGMIGVDAKGNASLIFNSKGNVSGNERAIMAKQQWKFIDNSFSIINFEYKGSALNNSCAPKQFDYILIFRLPQLNFISFKV